MSATTAATVQNPSPLRHKTFYFCVLRRPSHLCLCAEQPQNTHSENQANLRCSELNTDFLRCTAFREYPHIERSITRRRANHPQPPSAQPTHRKRLKTGLQRTPSKMERRFNKGNMAVENAFGSKSSLGEFRCGTFNCFPLKNQSSLLSICADDI